MPTYDYRCITCGYEFERSLRIADRAQPLEEPCPTCDARNAIERNYAAKSVQTTAFATYFDMALGVEVTSMGQRHELMRGTIDPDSGARVGKMDYRDKMSKGDLSARLDRINAQQREGKR